MKLFSDNGHVTDEAIRAMAEYKLNDADTISFCEHIAECDACCERYTKAIEAEELFEPSKELEQDIFKAIDSIKNEAEHDKSIIKPKSKKDGRIVMLKLFKFTVAAALTFVIWGRAIDLEAVTQNYKKPDTANRETSISQMFSDFTGMVQGGLTKSMNSASDFLRFWDNQPQNDKNDKSNTASE